MSRSLFFLAPLLFAAPLAAQTSNPNGYTGFGFVDSLPVGASPPRSVELLDLGGAATPELVVLLEDGTLFVNLDATEYGTSASTTGIVGIAVTRGATDRLWATDGASVSEVLWNATLGQLDLVPASDPQVMSGTVVQFRGQERSVGSRLLAIDSGGQRARVLELVGGQWTPQRAFESNPTSGAFHSFSLIDWFGVGTDDFAFAADQGLLVIAPDGSTIVSAPAEPDDSWLNVLDGSVCAWGRDLLFWHLKPVGSSQASMLVVNGVHAEVIDVAGLSLHEIAFGDFSNVGDGRHEVVLSRGDQREAWVLEQSPGASMTDPIFSLDPLATPFVELDTVLSAPGLPARVAAFDIDKDGDDDVVFVNELQQALYAVSSAVDEEALRVQITSEETPSIVNRVYSFNIDAALPAGADEWEYEIYWQPNYSSNVQLVSVGSGSSSTVPLSATLPPFSAGEVVQFLIRGVDSTTGERFPARVEHWSPDSGQLAAIESGFLSIYRWLTNNEPGGTTRRPKIIPGP